MDILVTLNANYMHPLKVMLKSMFLNNEEESFHIYVMHSSLTSEEQSELRDFVNHEGHELTAVSVPKDSFKDAPVVKHYSKEMYYRLLAFKHLPEHLDKILYLDPDILVINEIRSLYDTDISNYLFAAAEHERASIKEVNKWRLMPYEIDGYYNSGVMLMNLRLQREQIDEAEIYKFVRKNKMKLILPDQDIMNALYGKRILPLDEIRCNYDPRFYLYHKLKSNGLYDMDYIIHHTSIIHFCGKKKPWHSNYSGRFHSLYKHYEKLALGSKSTAIAGNHAAFRQQEKTINYV